MRLFRTRFAIFCMVVCAMLVLAGCKAATSSSSSSQSSSSSSEASSEQTPEQEAASQTIEGLKQDGVLTVGVRAASTAPFITSTEESLEGLDVDLGATLADELGLSVEFVSVEDVATGLAENCDVVMDVPENEANGFDVMGVYAQNALSLFHHGEPAVLNTEDINGKTVGVQNESPAQVSLRLTGLALEEVPTATVNEAFDAIDKGEVDFVLCNAAAGGYLSSWRDEIGFAGALEEPVSVGIAIPSGEGSVQTALRGAFDRIKENGVLDEVRRNWLGNLPSLTSESVISNVPGKESSDELPAKPAAVQLEEVDLDAKDGSAAGANAVTMSEVMSMPNASFDGSASSSGQGQATQSYTDGYDGGYTGGSWSSGTGTGTGYTDYGGGGYYTESYGY